MDEVTKFSVLAYNGSGEVSLNYDALIDYKIDKKMSKYEDRIGDLEANIGYLFKNNSVAVKSINEINITPLSFDKAEAAIGDMEDNEDIRTQIQCATRVIKQIDILRKSGVFDENKRKIITFLRTVLKINCDNKIFTGEQLKEFKNVFSLLRHKDVKYENLLLIEKKLRKAGLKTMVSWE